MVILVAIPLKVLYFRFGNEQLNMASFHLNALESFKILAFLRCITVPLGAEAFQASRLRCFERD